MAKEKNLWRIVMLGIICASVSFTSCSDEFKEAVNDLFGWNKSLEHGIDNRDTKVVDNMAAKLLFTENERLEAELEATPAMEATIQLAKSSVVVYDSLVDKSHLAPDSVDYDGKEWIGNQASDNTTLQWYLPGGQIVTVPVNISALRTQYRGRNYLYGTDSLIRSALSVKYLPLTTRGSETTDKYNAVYEVDLTFKEVNAKDSVFTVKLRANECGFYAFRK